MADNNEYAQSDKLEQRITKLIAKLRNKDEDRVKRMGAVIGLGRLGDDRAIDPLIDVLSENDDALVQFAIRALVEIGTSRAIEPFMDVIKNRTNPNLQNEAIWALNYLGDERAIPILEWIRATNPYQPVYSHGLANGAAATEAIAAILARSK